MATPIGLIALRKKGQTTCTEHKGKHLDLYCEKCDTLICLKCLSTSHKGHDICELSDLTPTKKQDIKNFIDKTEQNDLVQLQKYITSTDTLLKDNASNFETLSHKLKQQTEKLKQDLDLLTAKTLSLYKKMEEDNAKLIQTYKQDLEMYDNQLRQQIKEYKTSLQLGSHIEIHDTRCEIHSEIRIPAKPALGTASFIPNKNPQHHLELALGENATSDQGQASTDQDGSVRKSRGQKPSSTSQLSEPKGKKAVTTYKLLPQTKVLEEWLPPVYIESICLTTDGRLWTSDNSNTLTLLNRKGTVIQEVKHKTSINDISLSPTAHTLWVCDKENNILELVSGRLTHRFSTKEEPKCICVTASNHVIVGMANNISKFTTQGTIVLTRNATGTGKPLVCSPRRISECPVTHNVAVVDRNYSDGGDGKPHVVVMDTDFKELFVYSGDIPRTYKQPSHKGAKPFNPWDMVYDSVGNIIIGDYNNTRVLLISGGGKFLRIIHTDTDWTYAVGVDREDVLWAVVGGYGWRNVKLLQYSSV